MGMDLSYESLTGSPVSVMVPLQAHEESQVGAHTPDPQKPTLDLWRVTRTTGVAGRHSSTSGLLRAARCVLHIRVRL